MVALSPRPVYTIGTVGKRNYETVKEETKMVIQALGIILVLAVVMSVAAVGSSTSGRTDP